MSSRTRIFLRGTMGPDALGPYGAGAVTTDAYRAPVWEAGFEDAPAETHGAYRSGESNHRLKYGRVVGRSYVVGGHSMAAETRTENSSNDVEPKADDRIVVARKLTKVYDSGEIEVRALRGVDLDVHQGEMVAVMGPSGCGKTTLLNCLSGIDEFTGGEVWVGGHRLSSMNDNEKTDFRAMKMGFIFQNYNLLPVLRSVENVELPLLVRGDDPKEARRKALATLEAVGLHEEAMKKPAELSGGQQQRVSIARALVNEPDIVFGDEPTGNLDSETTREVLDVIKRLHKEKRLTFIIVTHDATVGNATERVITMRNGLILKSFRPVGV
jgi:putative ABC transport system ATP-binding protein